MLALVDQAAAAVPILPLRAGAEAKVALVIHQLQLLHKAHVVATETHHTELTDLAARAAQVKRAKHQTTHLALAVMAPAEMARYGRATALLIQAVAAVADTTVTRGTVFNLVARAVAVLAALKANQDKMVKLQVVVVAELDTLLTLTQLVLLD